MALELRQNLKLSQQLLMTPQLQQAIKLLQLSRFELEQFVAKELSENPLLEEVPTNPSEELETPQEATSEQAFSEHIENASEIVDKIGEQPSKDVDWDVFSRQIENQNTTVRKNNDDNQFNYENLVTKNKSLMDHLENQIREITLQDKEKDFALKIIGNLSERGYLEVDWLTLIEEENIDLTLAEGVLDTIQRLDPPGVGARTLKECLLIQLREYKEPNPVVKQIVIDHLEDVAKKNYNLISKTLGIPINEVINGVSSLMKLNPSPGSNYSNEALSYIVPDVYVFKSSGKWHVVLNEEGLPQLKICEHYKSLAKSFGKGDEKSYIQDKLKAASWLIKSVYQRQKTIFRVTECIVAKQQNFFEHGPHFLMPMILKDVANELSVHESTISRVSNNKYVHTPCGIFELKYFFNSSIAKKDGGELASKSVKAMIKKIIDQEDGKKPLSDQKIVSELGQKGVELARRTVAKYREQMGILPSSKRKKYF